MEMLNKDLKTFPKNGSIELATQKLVSAIADGKLNEKEIDFLSQTFRFYYPLNKYEQKDDYGKPIYGFEPTKLSLANFSREEMEQGIKAGLEKNNDFLLDMQYSGQLVPVPNEIYTNDRDTLVTKEADIIYKELLNGESVYSYSLFDSYEAKDFYCGGLLKDLYDSDKFAKLREADADVYKVTEEFLSVIKNEEPAMRDKLLQEFHDRLEDAYDTYLDCGDEKDFLEEDYQEKATETLKSKGFLNDAETYLMLGTNIDWLGNIGIRLKKVEKLEDMIKAITPDAEYTIDLTHKANTPYFEAMVYSHDVPTGSHCYLLPESQWGALIGYDKETKTFNQGYKFIEDFIKKEYRASREGANKSFAPPLYYGESLKEIFNARKKEIEMDLEAEKNPIVAKMKKVYDEYIYDNYYDNTIEKIKDDGIYKAWDEVKDFLANKIVQGTQISKKDFKTCEELLIKFNPTLDSDKDICKYFKCACQEEIQYNKKYAEKNNQR